MFIEKALFRTSTPGNVWQVMKIAFPLILASAGHTINLFTDRLMLQHFSADAMSAAFPAGLTSFSFSCFFVGTVSYANAFVAQYHGANRPDRVGAAVWQSIYMAIFGGILMALTYFIAEPLFDLMGHEVRLRPMEVSYFRILGLGGAVPLLSIALCTFWGGRGETKMIMIVNLLITAVNVPLNWLLIFEHHLGSITFPALGVNGAAYGTIGSGIFGILFMLAFFFHKTNRNKFHTCSMAFDRDMFLRLFKFGGPNGIQLLLDLAAFNAFVVLLGKIGSDVLNASGVAFSLNSLAMIPMFGLGQTVSILVGQGIGACDIDYAKRSVSSARFILFIVLIIIAGLFWLYPEPSLKLFGLKTEDTAWQLAVLMLKFIGAYLVFDGMNILYGSAIKGAGDTKFSMWVGASFAWILYGLPCLFVYYFFSSDTMIAKLGKDRADSINLWTLWTICVLYIMILGVVFYLRYRGGKWQHMRVIEAEANDHPRGAIPKEHGVDAFHP